MSPGLFQNGEFTNPRSRPPARSRNLFFCSWWVVLFVIFCLGFYFQGSRKRDSALSELSFRLQEMEKARTMVCQEREELQLRLQSQSDPAWIEMILMRDLGVVPEGWVKVRFTH